MTETDKSGKDPALYLVFAISLLMALCLLMIALAEPVANRAGVAHEVFGGMNAGGDGAARLANISTWVFLFQSLLYGMFVCLCLLAVNRKRRDLQLYLALAVSYLIMFIVWWNMYFGHQQFLATGETDYFLGFPVATAWQLYGTWLSGIPLMLIYSVWFSRYVFSDADEEAFQRLLSKTKAGEHSQ